eukprot:Rmarinus@m.26270
MLIPGPNLYLDIFQGFRALLQELDLWSVGDLRSLATHDDEVRFSYLHTFMDGVGTLIRQLFSWGIPNREALECIRRHCGQSGLIEVGAGTGYWAFLLHSIGLDVIAVDISGYTIANNTYHTLVPGPFISQAECDDFNHRQLAFYHVQRGDESVVSRYPSRTLLLCWPPREDDKSNMMAYNCVQNFAGETLLYVGEWRGQTTRESQYGESAGRLFQEYVESNFYLTETVVIPNWPFSRDKLMVWRRKNALPRHAPVAADISETKMCGIDIGLAFAVRAELVALVRERWLQSIEAGDSSSSAGSDPCFSGEDCNKACK